MPDMIDTLVALDDAALSAKVGLAAQLKEARDGLEAMAKLDGEARKEALKRVESMFAPHVYPSEFKWIAKDAARTVACKDQVSELRSGCVCDM